MLNTVNNYCLDFLPNKHSNNYPNTELSLNFAAKQHSPNSLQVLLDLEDLNDIGNIRLSPEKMLLLEQADANRETAIFHAVRENKLKVLKILLQCGANIFHENTTKQMAVEIAYLKKTWACVLLLLNNDSLFPRRFNSESIPETQFELLSFIERKNRISELITYGETKELRRLIDEGYLTHSFKNIYNQSAVFIAFSKQKYEMYVLLKSRGFKELWHEQPIEIDRLSCLEKSLLKNVMASYVI